LTEDDGAIVILDQTALPDACVFRKLTSLADVAQAIRTMQVRGAPLIGATAAYGVALALSSRADDATLAQAIATLAATRPTAVNLTWALARMRNTLGGLAPQARPAAAWCEARAIAQADRLANAAIGQTGLTLLESFCQRRGKVAVMTHCNAGWLATVAHGTALAPVYAAHSAGLEVMVWVSETRPRNQGLLTAWELAQAGVPYTLITDNAAGHFLARSEVDLVIVGADRIAANGDTANKVGTYLKALAARAHHVPFYVAAPLSTIDFSCPDGTAIPIEQRDGSELGAGALRVANPAFDVTPVGLITGIITERGLYAPEQLRQLIDEEGDD
jgi:methylthioribose-1-phosphate isomerase